MTTDPTTPRPTDAAIALDKAWRELEADALASDGPIRDRDVREAIKRNRARIEAAALATIDPRVIAIGQAVDALVAVTHPLDHIVIARSRHGSATAWNAYTMNNTDSPRQRPPEADALAVALTDQERSHD